MEKVVKGRSADEEETARSGRGPGVKRTYRWDYTSDAHEQPAPRIAEDTGTISLAVRSGPARRTARKKHRKPEL